MSTISKFLLINTALVSLVWPSSAFASQRAASETVIDANKAQVAVELSFDPPDGGECTGDGCAGGGAY